MMEADWSRDPWVPQQQRGGGEGNTFDGGDGQKVW